MEVLLIICLLSVSVFIFWYWLIGKWVKQSAAKIIYAGMTTVFVTPAVFFVALYGLLFLSAYYSKHEFDKLQWGADPESRYKMTTDLIENKLLVGKSKEEVRMLLGDERRLEWTKNGLDCWQYYIGDKPTSGMDLDPDAIDVYFKDGKVVRVYEHET